MTDRSLDPPPAPRDAAPLAAGRRKWLVTGVAGVAALTGVGLSWLNRDPATPADAALAALWSRSFEAPGNSPVVMRGFVGHPLILNFWATWCPPCVEELPLLDRFYAENRSKSWQVLGLAVDQLAAVQVFLKHRPVRFPIAIAGLAGIELSKALGNLSGGLPFTVVIGSAGQVLQRKIGRIMPSDLVLWSTLS